MKAMVDRDTQRRRVDDTGHPLDPARVIGPWVLGAWATVRLLRRLR